MKEILDALDRLQQAAKVVSDLIYQLPAGVDLRAQMSTELSRLDNARADAYAALHKCRREHPEWTA